MPDNLNNTSNPGVAGCPRASTFGYRRSSASAMCDPHHASRHSMWVRMTVRCRLRLGWNFSGFRTVPATHVPGSSCLPSSNRGASGQAQCKTLTLQTRRWPRFPGSPTIRVDGVDVEPEFTDPGDYTPRCRIYWTESGASGIPERAWIESGIDAATRR